MQQGRYSSKFRPMMLCSWIVGLKVTSAGIMAVPAGRDVPSPSAVPRGARAEVSILKSAELQAGSLWLLVIHLL